MSNVYPRTANTPAGQMTVAEAEVLVRELRLDLEVKQNLIRAKVDSQDTAWLEELLEDRPDLQRAGSLRKCLTRREKRYKQLRQTYKRQYKEKLSAEEQQRPFSDPFSDRESIANRDYLMWLTVELKQGAEQIEALLRHPRLCGSDRQILWAFWDRKQHQEFYLCDFHKYKERREADLRSFAETRSLMAEAYQKQLRIEVKRQLQHLRRKVKQAARRAENARNAEATFRNYVSDLAARRDELIDKHTRDEKCRLGEALAALQNANRREEEERARKQQEDRRRAYQERLRREQEVANLRYRQEQDWWAALAERPLAELVPRLFGARGERADAALDRLLQMGEDEPYIHDELVQAFLRREVHRRASAPGLLSPAFLALLGRVALEDRIEARRLRAMLQERPEPGFSSVLAYLDFLLSDGPVLGGNTRFDSLAPEDLYLAACYWDLGGATCAGISTWDYASVETELLHYPGESDSKLLKTFKVGGLQPRIAELALREVCRRLEGQHKAEQLRDLNAEVVAGLPQPWTLSRRPVLPGADWRDWRGREYDVKCNLFFRSTQEKEGLRGLFIRPEGCLQQGHHYPGFIFFATTGHDCSWCYIGVYRQTDHTQRERVCPFLFRLPARCRFVHSGYVPPEAVRMGAYLLRDWRLSLSWHLAVRSSPVDCHADDPADRMLDDVVSRCARSYAGIPLEEALWRAITEVALEGCSHFGQTHVAAFLGFVGGLLRSPALPLRLPRLGDEPLLCRWVDQVLKPITANWSRVRCPGCGKSGHSGAIHLGNILMNSGGSIEADFACGDCGKLRPGVRILTHCLGCGQYPLLIGVNEWCDDCNGGLVCHSTHSAGVRCNHCKRKDCPGFTKRQQEQADSSEPPDEYAL